ncbi:MAG: 50S ribosomal protein L18 [Candidatus Diapherotrites archaeon]|nr:50S ribosomal protein L18 [Candidatus Diapherotrites archaeon]
MAKNANYKVAFRRRREKKTNYKKRLAGVKSRLPKMVIRQSNKYFTVQTIKFEPTGDKIIAMASSKELEKFGWNAGKRNLPAAYLTGLLAGMKTQKAGLKKAIWDIGFKTPVHGARCFAALKGAIESGLEIPSEAKALPSDERVSGKHIEDYAKKLSDEEFNKRFSGYAKNKVDAKNLVGMFESAKQKIMQGVKE